MPKYWPVDDPYDVLGVAHNATPHDINRARARLQRSLIGLQGAIPSERFASQSEAIDAAWHELQGRGSHRNIERRTTTPDGRGSGPGCSTCGAAPAIDVLFRQRVARNEVVSIAGYLCRTCGVATFRNATNKTLLQGFWRLLSLVSTIAIVRGNAVERHRIVRLQAGAEQPDTMDPGSPLLLRSGILAVAATVVLLVGSVSSLRDVGSAPTVSGQDHARPAPDPSRS